MITSRTIATVCLVGIVIFTGIWLVFTQHYEKSKVEETAAFEERNSGLDEATRRELIRQDESRLNLETASSTAGFKKGSLLENLYKYHEIRKIIEGTWKVEKSSNRSKIVKARFEGKNYYLYSMNVSGKEEITESGRYQVNSEFISLNPSAGNKAPKHVKLIDRRYFVMFDFYSGDELEFMKTS